MSSTTAPHSDDPVGAFTHTLRAMSPDDIRRHASQLEATRDDLAWWRSTIDVDRRLRETHRSRDAALAAHAASDAVHAAAHDGEHGIDTDIVVAVSRAAAEVARGLVAGHHLTDSSSLTTTCDPSAVPAGAIPPNPRPPNGDQPLRPSSGRSWFRAAGR